MVSEDQSPMGRIETMEPLGPTATEDDGQRGLKATALIKYFQSYKIEMMTEIRFDQTDYMHGFNSERYTITTSMAELFDSSW